MISLEADRPHQPLLLQQPHERPPADAAVLHRIADEDEFEVELLAGGEQLEGFLMAEHRGFIDDDPAASGGLLHLVVEQEMGDGMGVEAVLVQHVHRRRRSCPDR